MRSQYKDLTHLSSMLRLRESISADPQKREMGVGGIMKALIKKYLLRELFLQVFFSCTRVNIPARRFRAPLKWSLDNR